jgi:hypothetical protein
MNQAKLELRLEGTEAGQRHQENSQIKQRRGFDDVGEGFAYGLVSCGNLRE